MGKTIEQYEAKIRDLKELLEISKSLSSNLEYHSLLDSLIFACMGHARVTKAGLFIKSNLESKIFTLYRNYEGFNTTKSIRYEIPEDSEVVELFKKNTRCYTMPELLHDSTDIAAIKPFTILEPTLIIPIVNKGNMQGMIVLGEKIENLSFPEEEKEFLLNIASLAAIAIYNAFLYEVSTTDLMTKLKLRHVMFQSLRQNFLSKDNLPITLLMIDIDKFKRINDTYGHAFGDKVIKEVTGTIRSTIRLKDVAARYGGEEFTVVLYGISLAEGVKIAERIRKKVEETPCTFQGETVPVTISIGITEYTSKRDKVPSDLIKRADSALYRAKESGRNRVIALPG